MPSSVDAAANGPRRMLRRLLLALALLLLGTAVAAAQGQPQPPSSSVRPPAGASAPSAPPEGAAPSDAELWRKIRQGQQGQVSIPDKKAGRLVQSEGEAWRNLRNGPVTAYGGQALLAVLGVLALYFVVRGRIRISGGRSGRAMPRFSLSERIVHWFAAGLWLLLAVTGLVILFGRPLLIPLLGREGFAVVAAAAIQAHNLMGPIFALATLLLAVTFVRGNFPSLVDIKWLLKGGGFFGGHASSTRYNLGEKVWYWLAVVLGLALSATGFALLFADAVPDLETLQFAQIVHAVAALVFIAIGLGHIYLATIGMDGALEGMTTGTVDEAWARDHHDLWYEEHKAAATKDRRAAEAAAAAGKV